MRWRLQFGVWLCGLALSATLLLPCAADQRGKDRPPRPTPPPRAERHEERRNDRPPNANRPQYTPPARPNENHGAPPPNAEQRFHNMTPQEKQRVAQNAERLKHLPPGQQQELQQRAQVWEKMTPAQRDHIRNDVLPKWRQMPPDRRQAIQQRLRVLQNMPESARNQRLSDPNFTQGMSAEDKATLRDLSHLHVGGAPEPPPNE